VPSIQMYSALMAIVVSPGRPVRPAFVSSAVTGYAAGHRQTYVGSRFMNVF